ncbi:MAG: hypothetical protein JNM47_04330 [Hyphomonadaceae bacterium]|nr:hypothetical protein [Hyphomonadaceae bacterium]
MSDKNVRIVEKLRSASFDTMSPEALLQSKTCLLETLQRLLRCEAQDQFEAEGDIDDWFDGPPPLTALF